MRTEKIKISIIIPSFNHVDYLHDAINSVLRQTFSAFELIVIDDASTDNSWEIIKTFKDTRIRAFHHDKNCGASNTMNEALSLARGRYITILNSDDVFHPRRLEILYAYIIRHKVDILSTDVQLWNHKSLQKEFGEAEWLSWFEHLKSTYIRTDDFLTALLSGNFVVSTSNLFFKRDIYPVIGGFKKYRYVYSYDFALRALHAGFKAAFIPQKLLKYRLHDQNSFRKNSMRSLFSIQEHTGLLLKWLPKLTGQFAENPERLRTLQHQLEKLYRYTNGQWKNEIQYQLNFKDKKLRKIIEYQENSITECRQTVAQQQQQIQQRDQWIYERDLYIHQLKMENQELRQNWVHRCNKVLSSPLRYLSKN